MRVCQQRHSMQTGHVHAPQSGPSQYLLASHPGIDVQCDKRFGSISSRSCSRRGSRSHGRSWSGYPHRCCSRNARAKCDCSGHKSDDNGVHVSNVRAGTNFSVSLARLESLSPSRPGCQHVVRSMLSKFFIFHFITYSLGCGASSDSSDILA